MNPKQLEAVAALWDAADEAGDVGIEDRDVARKLADAMYQMTVAFPPDHPIHQVEL